MAWEPSSVVWMKIWSQPALKEVMTLEACGNFKYIRILFDFKYGFTKTAVTIWRASLHETHRMSQNQSLSDSNLRAYVSY